MDGRSLAGKVSRQARRPRQERRERPDRRWRCRRRLPERLHRERAWTAWRQAPPGLPARWRLGAGSGAAGLRCDPREQGDGADDGDDDDEGSHEAPLPPAGTR